MKLRAAVVGAVTLLIGLGLAPSLLADVDMPATEMEDEVIAGGMVGPAVDELGNPEHGPCVKDLLNLPALDACEDAEGRVILDLPTLKLVSPPLMPENAPNPAPTTDEEPPLPKTGVRVVDLLTIGLATAGLGFVLLRRLRFAVSPV